MQLCTAAFPWLPGALYVLNTSEKSRTSAIICRVKEFSSMEGSRREP